MYEGPGAMTAGGGADTAPRIGDRELLDALRRDPGALATLYDRHASLVYGLALAVLRDPGEAQDLTQEVFVSLYERESYDPVRGAFEAYLISFTRSRAIDRLRRGGRHLRLLKQWHESDAPRVEAATPHHATAARQRAERVRRALDDLSEREREVIELAYYRDMSQVEIAEHLGAPLGSVKSWARRALARLQGSLNDLI